MGCTDILGISKIKTEARMTYIGVGTAPILKGLGKGAGERVELEPSAEEQLKAWPPHSFSLGLGLGSGSNSHCLSSVGFLSSPRRFSQGLSLRIFAMLDYLFQNKVIRFGCMGCEFCVLVHT